MKILNITFDSDHYFKGGRLASLRSICFINIYNLSIILTFSNQKNYINFSTGFFEFRSDYKMIFFIHKLINIYAGGYHL
jgi:hypothetical protein